MSCRSSVQRAEEQGETARQVDIVALLQILVEAYHSHCDGDRHTTKLGGTGFMRLLDSRVFTMRSLFKRSSWSMCLGSISSCTTFGIIEMLRHYYDLNSS